MANACANMTARDIQRRLMVDLYRRSMVPPNYTPSRWFECDIFELTKAGYFREYEIKLTTSDFRADQKKERTSWRINGENKFEFYAEYSKHQRLREHHTDGPTQFWFVCPRGLIQPLEVPLWSGLIYATDHTQNGYSPPWNVRLEVVRAAPRLHGQKCDPKTVEHARGVCYWRYMNLFLYGKQSTIAKLPDADEVGAEVGVWKTQT